MEELIMFLHSIAPLSPKLEKWLRKIIRKYEYKAGDKILVPGEKCDKIFFVSTGLIRIYHMLGKKEVSDWFIKEGDVCISVGSFFDQSDSEEFLVALEDCECWGINFEELEKTFTKFIEFNIHGRKISNRYYAELYRRSSSLKRQTPQRKYEMLLDKNETFLTRISQDDMASYLDVGRRTYFEIKKNYMASKKAELRRNKRRGLK
ncbi:MAG TPA: Crp/Fnr family transcriptional regulator [Puia sp.]|nr:Crp/Fnr family transcriptional regulator [Puia sp.]